MTEFSASFLHCRIFLPCTLHSSFLFLFLCKIPFVCLETEMNCCLSCKPNYNMREIIVSMKELSMDRICRKSYNERDLYTIRGKGMTLQQLKIFGDSCGVWEHFGGSTKLFISQPSLSAAIQNLEKGNGRDCFFTPPARAL